LATPMCAVWAQGVSHRNAPIRLLQTFAAKGANEEWRHDRVGTKALAAIWEPRQQPLPLMHWDPCSDAPPAYGLDPTRAAPGGKTSTHSVPADPYPALRDCQPVGPSSRASVLHGRKVRRIPHPMLASCRCCLLERRSL